MSPDSGLAMRDAIVHISWFRAVTLANVADSLEQSAEEAVRIRSAVEGFRGAPALESHPGANQAATFAW